MGVLASLLEPALTVGSSAVAQPLSGLWGILNGFDADSVRKAQDALTYQPYTDGGKKKLQSLGDLVSSAKTTMVDNNPPVKAVVDAYTGAGDKLGEISPTLGTIWSTLPAAASMVAGPTGRAVDSALLAAGQRVGPSLERAVENIAPKVMARGGLPAQLLQDLTQGTTSNMARMSQAEAVAKGYWHPVGDGKKLPIPVGEMKATYEDVSGLAPWKLANPEAMQGGAIHPLVGDRSITGKNLTSVGDAKFNSPVYLGGGYDFMRNGHDGIWAADKGSTTGILNKINEAADVGNGNVFGVYSSMGPKSMNYNTMMSDSLYEQAAKSGLKPEDVKNFDRQVAALRPEWKGLLHPESRADLDANGALRHVFVDRMKLDEFQNAGFPNIAYTRWALTDPRLLDEPMYSNGLSIGKMSPGAQPIYEPKLPHKTYNTQLPGEYFGGFERSIPMDVMYPDFIKARRAGGFPESGDVRSFQLGLPIQKAHQEWLDGVMNYLLKSQ